MAEDQSLESDQIRLGLVITLVEDYSRLMGDIRFKYRRYVPSDAEFICKTSESLPSLCENTAAHGVMAAEVGRGAARIIVIHEHMSVSRIFWGAT
jgi:hypothetical protein